LKIFVCADQEICKRFDAVEETTPSRGVVGETIPGRGITEVENFKIKQAKLQTSLS
jgi:hypothetical protein